MNKKKIMMLLIASFACVITMQAQGYYSPGKKLNYNFYSCPYTPF